MNAATTTGLKVGFGLLGDAASKAYGVVSKTSKAMAGLAKNLSSASAEMAQTKPNQDQTSNVIIGNFGMAGSAGRQRVSGNGVLPPLKATKARVSDKMPTEKLLDTAVKYLASIDKSLKSQLEFEKRSFEQQTRDDREAIIEQKKAFNFSDIKGRFSNLKSDTKDALATFKTVAKITAGLALAAALVASSLDEKQLEELKKNVEAFKEKFAWLNEIPAGGLAGFLFGVLFGKGKGIKGRLASGLKGGVAGIITSAIADVAVSRMTGGEITGDTKSVLNLAATGALGYFGYQGIKSGFKLKNNLAGARTKMAATRANATYLDPKTGQWARTMSSAAGPKAQFVTRNSVEGVKRTGILSFFKSARWRKFLTWLTKKGKRKLITWITKKIALAATSAAIAATGVGAVVGIAGFLFNVFGLSYAAYQVYQMWKEFTSDENSGKEVSDAEVVKESAEQPDAAKVSGSGPSTGIVSKSETGKPEEAQAFFESKGWTKEQAAGIVGNLIVESGLKTNAYNEPEDAYGIAQWRAPRQADFQKQFKKSIKESSFKEQLEFVNWELNNTEKSAGNRLRGATSANEAAQIVDKYYERSSGEAIQQRIANANSIAGGNYSNLQGGGGGTYSGSSSASGGSGSSTAMAEGVGKLIGTIAGSIIKPGVEKNMVASTPNASERINNESMKLQNDITFGIKSGKTKEAITTPAKPGKSPGIQKPIKSISSMDPNYQNLDVVKKYLAHFRMAA